MRDETNIKTNFLGRDGFRWFIGQIPENNHKVLNADNAPEANNWGQRRRVRIMGYHPGDDLLPDTDLSLIHI